MIKKIIIEVKGKNIEMSLKEAKKLHEDLKELFDHDTFRYVPYYPYPYRTYSWWDTTPQWTGGTDDSVTTPYELTVSGGFQV